VIHAEAATKTVAYKYTKIFYYIDGDLAFQSLSTYPSSIDVVAPQSYSLDSTGNLKGSVDEKVLTFSKNHKIKVMPLVTNGKFSEAEYKAILNDTSIQDKAINALVTEGKKFGYWGWQIDFEGMDFSYRDKYSAFIKKAYDVMKQNNLVFSVAVIAKISDNPEDYPNDLWQKTIGVYDYATLTDNSDFISLMSYDDPNSIGPIVEYSWLKQVLSYSIKFVPHEKLSLGIPLYYWQWNNISGEKIGAGGREGIYNVFNKHKVVVSYSVKQEAPYLTYWSHTKQYIIWYENARSLKKKVNLIKQYKLNGFSAWALGLELPSIYGSVK
jgi:spore germination protein YaaH